MKKMYSNQEIKLLSENPNVKYVRRNRLVLTFEFRLKLYDEWVNNFYNRILNQKDPLALYRKQAHKTQNKNKRVSIQTSQTYTQYKEPSKVSPILVTLVIIGFIIMMILSILYFFMS